MSQQRIGERLEPRNWLPLGVRQRLRRWQASLRGEPAVLVYGPTYQHELPGVPIDALRGEQILLALAREGLIGRNAVLRPEPISFAKLERVHDPDYLAHVHEPPTFEATFGLSVSAVIAEQVVDLQRAMAGGTIIAARAAWREHKLAINLGGGFHHAHRDRGHGFCLINDIAAAIAELRESGMREPIAVIDLDVHDGDGTRSLFADDDSVWTFSIHNEHWGPVEARSSTSIALGAGVDDERYLAELHEQLPAMLDAHEPKLVFYLAGCDPADDDGFGNWHISDAGMLARDRYVIEQLHARGIESIVWLLGGGYGSDAWRHTARSLISLLGGPSEPQLPTNQTLTLARFRELARLLDPRELSGLTAGELEFDESDLFGTVPQPKCARVLGYYTRTGIEIALERYGIFARLRNLGFDPRVEIDCTSDTGDTVRVFSDAHGANDERELLIEVRIARDRMTMPGHELLRIEWMLLQNPRASWVPGRAPLPGQRHPGLRMFEEVALLMLMICERLDLAGIVVVPSHYHVAARWHGRMRFVDPAVEGRFCALEHLIEPLSLGEASMAVERGRVVDLDAPERRSYEPAALVLPASDALRRHFDADWEAAAAKAEQRTHLQLRPS